MKRIWMKEMECGNLKESKPRFEKRYIASRG